MSSRLETRSARELRVVVTGDGVTVDQFLTTLRLCWRNGTRMEALQTEFIVPAAGPPRFYQVQRNYLENERLVTIGQLLAWKNSFRDHTSYEIGLRWFVHDSVGQRLHPLRGSDRAIGVLPADPMVVGGLIQILMFMPGGDGPGLCFHEVCLEDPVYFDFVTAGEIKPTPFNS